MKRNFFLIISMAIIASAAVLVAGAILFGAEKQIISLASRVSALFSPIKKAAPVWEVSPAPHPAEESSVEKKTGSGVLLPASDSRLTLLFFGDLMLDRNVKLAIGTSSSNFLLADLEQSGVFAKSDIISANLEGAVVKGGEHRPPENKYDFSFRPEEVSSLKELGFNFFNLANNHLADQGGNGIIETEKNLTDSGFSFAGCQDREVGACTSKIIEKKGRRIGLAGASMVYGKFAEEKFINEIRRLASTTDLVVVQLHWGIEYEHEAAKNQIILAHKLIEAGADMIIGHHPHVVGGFEIYKDKPIFYSLGNFIFDQNFSLDTREELGVKISTLGNDFQIQLLPLISNKSRLRLMNDKEKIIFLEKMSGWSLADKEVKKQIKAGFINITNNQ